MKKPRLRSHKSYIRTINMIEKLKNRLKQLAILDAIIEPEWEYRYYSYNSTWSDDSEMASLRNGSGGEWFLLFEQDNVSFKCTSPDDGIEKNFENIIRLVPKRFNSMINEPAFSMDYGSCIWYLEDNQWIKLGNEIKFLPNPETIQKMSVNDYCQYAEDYFEKTVDSKFVDLIFNGNFSIDLARGINPSLDLETLSQDIIEIGIKGK